LLRRAIKAARPDINKQKLKTKLQRQIGFELFVQAALSGCFVFGADTIRNKPNLFTQR
jgi:hypothetical protein